MTRAERNIKWISEYCIVPEGKLVGQPIRLRDWQQEIIKGIYDTPTRKAVITFGRKNGKGLALDTPIPTPSGWTTMGALRVGDEVFGSDGRPTRVEFVSPVHTGLRCWKLTFSDGSSIVADEQHRWLTRHSYRPWASPRKNGSGNGGRWREGVVTTPQIAESVHRPNAQGKKEHNHKILVAPATESLDICLPIEPYVLGAWLGDGTSNNATFTCGEEDIKPMCAALGAGLGGSVKVARYGARAPTIRTPGLGLQSALRDLGVLGKKHIPDQYLNAGTSQRWALLQGLMDTDGTVNRHSGKTTARASFTGTNEDLCHGVWRLARSLGLKATIHRRDAKLNGRVVGTKYDVSFPATRAQQVFRLTRKQALLPEELGGRSKTLTVVACDPVESVPTVCIKVAAADSLFLAGYGCVPTHNTALSACLLLLHLVGPEARPNSQLFSAAQSRDQAAILFSLAAKMVRQHPDLADYVLVRDSGKQLFCKELGTLYRALSAEASTAYGLSPVFVVHDELGQVKGPRSELYEALETATAAQDDPLSIIISTQAPTDADLLSLLIEDAQKGGDPRNKVWLYTADDSLDPFSEEAIRAANPAFGDFQNADEVRAMADSAKRMPSREASYRNLVLNQRVNLHNPLITKAVWASCRGEVLDAAFQQSPVYMGIDLSTRNDLTAVAYCARMDGAWHTRVEFFAPEAGVVERSTRDRVPYDLWAREGWLTLTEGATVQYEDVARRIADLCSQYQVKLIAFDRWRMDILKKEFERMNLELPLEPFGQGFQSMAPAVDELEGLLLSGQLIHDGNPILTWCASNAVTVSDPAGNRKLDKSKSTGRIDGIVALAMALGRISKIDEPVFDVDELLSQI